MRLLSLLACTAFALGQESRPNLMIVMVDDMGWSDLGCFGSEIETPHLDGLAENGLRFTQFYVTGRCCPTRASLLSGLYAHQAGIGHMTSEGQGQNADWGVDSYRGHLSDDCVTIADVLRSAGYRTLMSGKWHVGTFDGMHPTDRGFDRFYGMIRGASNLWRPAPFRLLLDQETPVEPPHDFYTTDAFTDAAIGFLEEAEAEDDEQPFFLYLSHTAPHWPLHGHGMDVSRYRWRYMDGPEPVRAARYAKAKELGIVTDAWPQTEYDGVDWSTLTPEKRDELDLRMALYAAQVDRVDQSVGRLLRAMERMGELENTLMLVFSDNGACAEGGRLGGGPASQLDTREGYWLTYGGSWANASNTPFRLYKHWVHEGGIASPTIVHWPAGIEANGAIVPQLGHLIDLMPTFCELAGATYPGEAPAMEGVSLVPAIRSAEAFSRPPVFWEHEGNRAMRDGDWKLVARHNQPWELYDLGRDRTETTNLAEKEPDRLARMIATYDQWAERAGVLPWRPQRPEGYTPPPRQLPKTYLDE